MLAALLYGPYLKAQIRPVAPGRKKTAAHAAPFQKGAVLIKLARKFEGRLPAGKGAIAAFGIAELDGVLQKLNVKGIRQEFALILDPAINEQSAGNANRALAAKGQPLVSAELLDRRHREFGFHLWYRLQFDSTLYLRAALNKLQSLKGIVDAAEPVLLHKATAFNDPFYPYQYSLNNTGQSGGTPGADIEAEQAWGITTGDSSVVVAVMDGGVKTDHEDLDSSMWFGKGYNFIEDTANIVADDHGTHVAGIIAARNNNGKGISGIAGGNGSPASGVRLMSCMIIQANGFYSGGAAAFVYAADNGAAISNNSWGSYGSFFYKEGIFADATRYFSKYGGGAATKGGLTIWGAGNNDLPIPLANSSYDVDNNLHVAATDEQDRKAGYSNHGEFIDISAPGSNVLSSVANPVNGYLYNYLSGTSMAAPMVSGVAALVASVAPGRFTADEVSGIILSTADNIDSLNPGFEGKLGSGRVNAYRAVLKAQQMAALPALDTVSNATVSRTCNGYDVSYTKNAAGNDVMIAIGLARRFSLPEGKVYNTGDSMGKEAKVIYRGPASSFSVTRILRDSAVHYVKIWSVSGSHYSGGTVLVTDSSFHTVRNPSFTMGVNNVSIQFGKVCPNSDVMVVVNSLPQFGKPQGALNVGSVVPGGGTVLYKGSADGFTHSGLSSGTYFYALYPVIGTTYGPGRFSGGYCFGSTAAPLPLKTSFEEPELPASLALFTPSQSGLGWEISNGATAHTGQGYAVARNFYNYNPANGGEASHVQTGSLDVAGADSVICRFAHAYAMQDVSIWSLFGADYHLYADTLSVVVSTDCGQTWQTAWKQGGYDLQTMVANPDFQSPTEPASPADWAGNKVNLTDLIPAGTGSIMVAFKSSNRGQGNIYLDDIHIYKVRHTDAGIATVIYPAPDACSSSFSPRVVLANLGINPLSSAAIHYKIDNGAVQSYNWSGNKAYEQTDTLTLPAITTTPGNHTLTVYTALPNGLADEVIANDTAYSSFRVLTPFVLAATATSSESFENPTFVPDQWRLADPLKPYNWMRISPDVAPGFVAASDTSAAFVNTFDNARVGDVLDLYSPAYFTGNADTVVLTFSRAAADYTGSGATTDKLDVLLTTDCGSTFATIYSKTGADLTTSPVTGFFYPTALQEWQSDTVDISNLVRNVEAYRFVFRVTNSFNNNVFLDNVQVHRKMANVALPLNLLTFTGKAVGTNSAQLAWRTANEVNTAYFELQRSPDGRSFIPVTQIAARGAAQTTTEYRYTDANLLPGQYYFRLRMMDKDGKQAYSQSVIMSLKGKEAITVYPIPAVDVVRINSNASLVGRNVVLTDMQGRIVKVIKITLLNQPLNIAELAAGTYLLKLPDATTVKITKM